MSEYIGGGDGYFCLSCTVCGHQHYELTSCRERGLIHTKYRDSHVNRDDTHG